MKKMEDESDKRKIQELVKKLRGLLLKFKKLEEKYRGSEIELKSVKEEKDCTEKECAEQKKSNDELNRKYHALAKKMKASLGLIQSLRTERKHSEEKYKILKDKAAKHLARMEKSRDEAETQRDQISKQRDEAKAEMRYFEKERDKVVDSVRGSEQEQAAHAETLRTNEILRARVSDLQTALTKAERDLRESRRRRRQNSEDTSSHFHEQTITVLRHENEIALKNAKAMYEREILRETRDMRLSLQRLEIVKENLETRNENVRRTEITERESHDRMEREMREAREKLREARDEESRLRDELSKNRRTSVDESLSSRVVELKTELAEERIRQGSLSRELTKSRDVFRKQIVEMEKMRKECESAKFAVELGKSQIALLSQKLSSSAGGSTTTNGILSQFWS